jgi:4'-phosphopantetheinyl transferase
MNTVSAPIMMHRESGWEDEAATNFAEPDQLLSSLRNEAHVYLAFADRHSNSKLLAWYRGLLSDEERKKCNGFYFARDRDLYVLSCGLIRVALSRYSRIHPDKWEFTRPPLGRPELAQSDGSPNLRFSVSRSHGLVACLVVLSIDAGVDVEENRKIDMLDKFFENAFTPAEISDLSELSESQKMQRFFALWTLKEAYVKGRGKGLALPLTRFSFYSDGEERICVSLASELQDIPSNWQFACYQPRRSHTVAVALDRKDRPDFRIRFLEALPQQKGLSFSCLKECPSEDMQRLSQSS